jgi:hypothetical protein
MFDPGSEFEREVVPVGARNWFMSLLLAMGPLAGFVVARLTVSRRRPG